MSATSPISTDSQVSPTYWRRHLYQCFCFAPPEPGFTYEALIDDVARHLRLVGWVAAACGLVRGAPRGATQAQRLAKNAKRLADKWSCTTQWVEHWYDLYRLMPMAASTQQLSAWLKPGAA